MKRRCQCKNCNLTRGGGYMVCLNKEPPPTTLEIFVDTLIISVISFFLGAFLVFHSLQQEIYWGEKAIKSYSACVIEQGYCESFVVEVEDEDG